MLSFPDIATAPRSYTTAEPNALAARLALSIAGDRPIRAGHRAASQRLEVGILQDQLQRWLDRMNAGARFIRPLVHVSLYRAVTIFDDKPENEDETYTVWIRNEPDELVGTVWTLERKWKALEARVPGLAAAALHAINHAGAHSFPLYTPGHAEYWATYQWWRGEDDESSILDDYRAELDDPKAKAPDDMPTRAWFNKMLPPEVCRPSSRQLTGKRLARVAHRRSDLGEIARQVIDLAQECRASHRRKSEFTFTSQDDNGFQGVGYSACLRWNTSDPMLRIYDDYTNEAANCEGVDDVFGWFVMDAADDMPALLAELEHYFRIVRKIERLIPLIATRYRS